MDKKHFLHDAWAVFTVAIARLRFIMVFVVAALVVGYWDNVKNYVDKWTRPPVAPDSLVSTSVSEIEYYCSMHPHVIREKPGSCPICGMPLTKRKKGEAQRLPVDVLARVQLTPQRVALANVQTSLVERRALSYDVNAVGVLDYDETKVARISARVAGRADQLFVAYEGQQVKQGDPLYSLYSPEVFTALREYLSAEKRLAALPADVPADVRADTSALMDASKQRMLLWGLTDSQLTDFVAEYKKSGKVASNITITSPISGIVVSRNLFQGGYVQTGDNVFTVADLSTLWLQARIYERDVPLVNIGDEADVTVDAISNASFTGKVTFKSFAIDPQTRTLAARVEVSNSDLKLRPGMFANATMHIPVIADAPAAATTAPTPTTSSAQVQAAYASALESYVSVQKKLAADSTDGVTALLDNVSAKLKSVWADPNLSKEYEQLASAVTAARNKPIDEVRKSFKQISSAMVTIGRTVGLPGDRTNVQLFHCVMVDAPWIQYAGGKANPYFGSEMLTCGDNLPPLPTSATPSKGAGQVLAVPRSAVIDTGKNKIVYVQSSQGVYDMHAVTLGPAAGEFYPVLAGLEEGQSVVTVGAFLVDAENRLNPANSGSADQREKASPPSGHGGMKM